MSGRRRVPAAAARGDPPARPVRQKSLGQNFLLDLNLTGRIARAGPLDGVTVVEIGPGPGGLTRALLRRSARAGSSPSSAIERAWPALGEIAAHYPGRLEIVAGDALRIRSRALAAKRPARIVANLPYNIATALLRRWLTAEPWPPWYDRLVLMFQREVAERIVAGQQDLRPAVGAGRLADAGENPVRHPSVGLRAAAESDLLGGAADPRARPLPCDRRLLERVTEAAFGQRRKMLRQSLKSLGADPAALLAAAGIEPTARAEEIPVEGFVALARRQRPSPRRRRDPRESGRSSGDPDPRVTQCRLRRFSLTAYQAPLCETVVDCPEPKGSEVLVRIERCGVCHSDLHMQDGYFALGDGKTLDVRAGRTLPFTLGHEIAGVIERAGPDATGASPARRSRSIPGSAAARARPARPARRISAPTTAISASRPTAASPRTCWCRIRAI